MNRGSYRLPRRRFRPRPRSLLRPLYNADFEDEHEDEDEYEKNQMEAHAYALHLQP